MSEIDEWRNRIICGDSQKILKSLPPESVDTIVTSPPYYHVRFYGEETYKKWDDGWYGEMGQEPSPEMFVSHLMVVFKECKRVLKKTGTFWLNMGDTKEKKSFIGIPEMVMFALKKDGWCLRGKNIWYKPSHMPSSVKDAFTPSWEYMYFFVKNQKYFFDLDGVRVPHKSLDEKKIRMLGYDIQSDSTQTKIMGFTTGEQIKGGVLPKVGDTIKKPSPKFKDSMVHSAGGRRFYWSEQRICQDINQKEIALYLKEFVKGKEKVLDDVFGETKWRHYTRTDESGACLPPPEDWLKLKKVLTFDNRYDEMMTKTHLVPVTDASHPLGKNPSDVITTIGVRKDDVLDSMKGLSRMRYAPNPDEPYASHPLGKNPSDVITDYSAFDDFWSVVTQPFKGEHYSVFPEALIERPIRAGCPTEVCCACGKPRNRITKTVGYCVTDAMRVAGCNKKGGYHGENIKDYDGAGAQSPSDAKKRILRSMGEVRETVGWSDCGCGKGFNAGVILDPFGGSGRVGIVARKMLRDYILIDISPKFCEIAQKQINKIPERIEGFK